MRWLEFIRLRSTEESFGPVKELLRSISQLKQPGLAEVKIYRHTSLETDLSIHLQWHSERPERDGSAPGLHLAHALKEFGLVDHSLWMEEEI